MIPAKTYQNRPAMAIPELKIAAWQFLALKEWHVQCPMRPFWRLYWNDAPGATLTCNNRVIGLEPEHVVLIPPYSFFSARLTGPVNHLFVHFMPGPRFADLDRQPAILPKPALLDRIIGTGDPTDRQELRLFALLLGILAELPCGHTAAAGMDQRIQKAIALLDSLPRPQCANARIARELCMGISNYVHLFHRWVGITPQQYLNYSQMDRARMRLRHSDDSISDIAADLGFANRYHFSTVFTRFNGVSPAAFRRTDSGSGHPASLPRPGSGRRHKQN